MNKSTHHKCSGEEAFTHSTLGRKMKLEITVRLVAICKYKGLSHDGGICRAKLCSQMGAPE